MDNEKEFQLVDMPVINQVVISEPSLVYSSHNNEFLEVIQIVLVSPEGEGYQFALSPDLARDLFRDI